MPNLSFDLSDEEYRLIHEYVSDNYLNLSEFICGTILDKIEDDLKLDEERILNARKRAENEESYDAEKVWRMIGETEKSR